MENELRTVTDNDLSKNLWALRQLIAQYRIKEDELAKTFKPQLKQFIETHFLKDEFTDVLQMWTAMEEDGGFWTREQIALCHDEMMRRYFR